MSMFNPQPSDYCRLDSSKPPQLVVVIDTEEEFNWSENFSRSNTAVQAMRLIHRVQQVFDDYHIKPVYVIDYPVASQPDGYLPLQEIYATNRCVIGAHLHPWVNPPFDEIVDGYHSFPGNLPRALEAAKLKTLGACIEDRFGLSPVIYKAGRYGVGPHTASILEEYGYEVDVSVCSYMNFSAEGGPDFAKHPPWPYWFGSTHRLLELPFTGGFAGVLRHWGLSLHDLASGPSLSPLRAVGMLARLGLVNKIHLSPEGHPVTDLIKLVRALSHSGLRVFSFAFHSPSVEPGHTPYVTSQDELEKFLSCCRVFFDFFIGELGGQPTTPLELKTQLAQT